MGSTSPQVMTAGDMTFLPQYGGATFTVDTNAETRCPVCGMKFFTGHLAPGSVIEIRCRKCKTFTKYKAV